MDDEHDIVVVGDDLDEDPSNEGCVALEEEEEASIAVDSIEVKLSAARDANPDDQPIDVGGKLSLSLSSSSSPSKLGISVK